MFDETYSQVYEDDRYAGYFIKDVEHLYKINVILLDNLIIDIDISTVKTVTGVICIAGIHINLKGISPLSNSKQKT